MQSVGRVGVKVAWCATSTDCCGPRTACQDLLLLSGFSNSEEKSNDVSPGGRGEGRRGELRQENGNVGELREGKIGGR